MSDYLDPLAFPFTVAELRVAVSFLASEAGGEELFQAVHAACAGAGSENARAAEARLQGSKDPADINDAVLMIPDELYAALALSSPTVERRVEALLAGWRAQNRETACRHLMWKTGHHPDAAPTPAVLAALDEEEATVLAEWSSLKTRVAAMRHKIRIEGPRT